MRDLFSWGKDLRSALRNSDDLKDYVADILPDVDAKVRDKERGRLAQLIAEVELGLTLLKEIAPEDPASSVSALLLGYRFPVAYLQNEEPWQLVQKARFYLIRRKGIQWERSLQTYINIPEIVRIFSLTSPDDVPQLIPSSTYPRRAHLYRQTLSKTPPHQKRKVELATEGYWYAKISHKGNSPVEIPIQIPKAVANLAPSPQVSFHRTRESDNPPHTVKLSELLLSAQEMDDKLAKLGSEPENYHSRLSGIALQLYDAVRDDFHPDTELKLSQLVHIVGLLNVGKSTLLEVLIYHFAKQGYRCALIVNDVVAAVRLASLFAHRLSIPAAPILGADRSDHLEKVYEPLLAESGEEIAQGGKHPAWRWFSPVCPLLALVRSQQKWEFGEEPCHSLYPKVPASTEREDSDEDDDWEELSQKEQYTCPMYYKCPRHQLERDISQATLWVLTPSSFIHTRVPRQVFDKKLTFAEAVYRECDFLFVDEADRVQVQFDEAFAPSQVLVDASGNSFLNKLGLKFATTIYNSDRRSMGAELFAAFKRAHDYAQIATDLILPRLHNQPELIEWLGKNPFTGRSLFAHIVRDLLDAPSQEENSEVPNQPKLTRKERSSKRYRRIERDFPLEEQRQHRKQLMQSLEEFLQAPLNRRRGGELSDIALTLLSAENERAALAEVGEWLHRWLEFLEISLKKTQFEEVKRNLYLAILITVLNDRLGFLIDHLSELIRSRIIDLHDLSQVLVYRPPRDYLPVVPSSPVGNILGFRYTRERGSSQGGKLEYFRYVGVGRALLLNFPHLWAVDDWDGPHTVLISGTSYAPGTPAYHIKETPTVLLEPTASTRSGDAGIAQSEFFFNPQQRPDGKYIALSGLPPAVRKTASSEMVGAICYKPGQAQSFLEQLFARLQDLEKQDPQQWSDRQRILLVTNSYDEAEQMESSLRQNYRVEQIENIAVLRRDNAPARLKGIRRGQIRDLKDRPTQIVIAPLMALERGHNILNVTRQAAFGAAVFLSRPMPVPDDWQTTVGQLNNWALNKCLDATFSETLLTESEFVTLARVEDRFYRDAVAKMLDLNCRAMSFKQLTPEERSVLCWTQLVSIWQIIGRLVRGGVPCLVHFLDVKFAPLSAEGKSDNETTSLLVGILKELQTLSEGEGIRPYQKTLMRSLYGAFFKILKATKELHHDL
ncbi:MAG: hypothetical protein MUD14_05895 [Hydrococcus sp. Prado102]|nr:hypothetical protein [Hydrococcus sp. Prado102]